MEMSGPGIVSIESFPTAFVIGLVPAPFEQVNLKNPQRDEEWNKMTSLYRCLHKFSGVYVHFVLILKQGAGVHVSECRPHLSMWTSNPNENDFPHHAHENEKLIK